MDLQNLPKEIYDDSSLDIMIPPLPLPPQKPHLHKSVFDNEWPCNPWHRKPTWLNNPITGIPGTHQVKLGLIRFAAPFRPLNRLESREEPLYLKQAVCYRCEKPLSQKEAEDQFYGKGMMAIRCLVSNETIMPYHFSFGCSECWELSQLRLLNNLPIRIMKRFETLVPLKRDSSEEIRERKRLHILTDLVVKTVEETPTTEDFVQTEMEEAKALGETDWKNYESFRKWQWNPTPKFLDRYSQFCSPHSLSIKEESRGGYKRVFVEVGKESPKEERMYKMGRRFVGATQLEKAVSPNSEVERSVERVEQMRMGMNDTRLLRTQSC